MRLAIQMYNEQNHSSPPSRDVLLEMARSKNATTLKMPTSSGVRLPPDRFCVTGTVKVNITVFNYVCIDLLICT